MDKKICKLCGKPILGTYEVIGKINYQPVFVCWACYVEFKGLKKKEGGSDGS